MSLTFSRGHKAFPVFHACNYWITQPSRSSVHNLESTMRLSKFGKGMLFSVEQAFVAQGPEEFRVNN